MKTLLLIDASALIHRAFHALPPLTTPEGKPIGAIYGLSSILLKTLKEQKPDFVAAALDRPEATFREEIFKDYKAHRPPTADELISQIQKAPEVFRFFGISVFEKIGFEADDIIGTIVEKLNKEKDLKIVILTGDLDALQLVSENVFVQTMKKGVSETFVYDKEAVREKYGFGPEKLIDYKALVGDPSDNVPGIKGVGPKTATKLILEFGSLSEIYEKMKDNHPVAKKILPYKNDALLSKKLVSINLNVPIELDLKKLKMEKLDLRSLTDYFSRLGFQSLVARLLRSEEDPKIVLTTNQKEKKDFLIIPSKEVALENKSALKSPKLKISFDWKEIFKKMDGGGVEIMGPLFDLKIAGWLLDPDQKDFSLGSLVKRFLFKDVSKADNDLFFELFNFFDKKIKDFELDYVFSKIEMPLIPILGKMEGYGISLDRTRVVLLKKEVEKELEVLAKKIYEEAHTSFNINSPKQVAEIVFEKLKIEGSGKKTSTGQKSTAEKILVELKEKHPIIKLILNYRESFKIKSAFVESFLELLGKDDRLRTTFIQTGTSTGRLSSSDPNLQNIPQESKWAHPLRNCFVAPEESSLLSFDYSQLELRLLAHVSDDEKLRDAFLKNLDVHELTASQVFNVPLTEVTPQMRRLGKTLNFGIVYGMGARGFAEGSGLSVPEAEKFIREYFESFKSIKNWQEKTKAEAKTLGFVKNLNGRRRWFLKSYREDEIGRFAINMPIQSLGADIIKLAMIESSNLIKKMGFDEKQIKLLLSIHDELLFEVRDDILSKIIGPLKKIMESAYPLSIPLKIESKVGKSWGEMKKIENEL